MQFKDTGPIYLQIADLICEKLLLGEWEGEGRIPAVRELAMQLEVNPNTVVRTYDFLGSQSIIFNQRGIGYFLAPDAAKRALDYRKDQFAEKELPTLFRNLYLLGIDLDELKPRYEKYKKSQKNPKPQA